MPELVRADMGDFLEGLIWIVIAVFWVIAQIVSRFAKGRREDEYEQPEETQEHGVESELKEFLESLGVPTQQQEPPPPQAPAPPPPPPVHHADRPRGERRRPAPPPPVRHAVTAADQHQAARRTPPPSRRRSAPGPIELSEDVIRKIQTEEMASINMRDDSFLVALESLRVPGMSLNLEPMHMTPPSALRGRMGTRAELRRAFVNKYVLGTPKAYGTGDSDFNDRIL